MQFLYELLLNKIYKVNIGEKKVLLKYFNYKVSVTFNFKGHGLKFSVYFCVCIKNL